MRKERISVVVVFYQEDDKDQGLISKADDTSIMLFFFKDKPLFGGNKRKVRIDVYVNIQKSFILSSHLTSSYLILS